jgi:translation initiation factor IF-2
MKLSELASEHNLDVELLREVVEEDLSIAIPKGMDTELKEADVKRILACDGLETADGKPFTPIIAKEFEEKHRKKVATKKGLATKKRKLEEDAEVRRREDEAKVEAERKRHAEELARREGERLIREQTEAEQARLRSEAETMVQVESLRFVAEEDMKRRESEAKRIAGELSAMRDAEAAIQATEAQAKEAERAQEAQRAQELSRQRENESAAQRPPADKSQESAPLQAVALAGGQPPAPTLERQAAPAAPTTPPPANTPRPAEVKPAAAIETPVKAAKGLGSKLASLAKATHEKADHSTKALPKPAPAASGTLPIVADETLSPDDRRRLIQDNIRKNLAMAQKVKDAKIAARKKPGFATIDRSKTPAPAGRGGPGAGRGPAKPGTPGRGPKRDPREHRADAAAAAEEERLKPGSRRRPLSTEEVDLSGRTEFELVLPATVREFSEASGIKSSTVIAKLFMAGVIVNINSVLEKDAVELLAMEFKKTVTIKQAEDVSEQVEAEAQAAVEEDKPEDLVPRPPVVTIMGHVDHGKTSLLDAVRKTQVAAGEAGGITQHIGAYTVSTPGGLEVTFIDTPGHEAFTEMRVRGSQVTDVVVIVVAADDGVMPQTREAINHAKAANVAIVVALNKIDKPEAQAAGQREKVIRELAEAGLQAEEWGGEIAVIGTSATTGQGIDELLERLTLETEILELKANHFAPASGTVIEAHRNEGQGVTATFLVRRGSLAVGDVVLAGVGYGRVRSMTDWKGDKVPLAGPSYAV